MKIVYKLCIIIIAVIYSLESEATFGSFKKKLPIIKTDSENIQVNINKNDVKAAIRMWQDSRWKSNEIKAARKKCGKVQINDIAVNCNLPEMQPIADLIVANYIIAVNLLDAFESTPNETEAIKVLVSSISLKDVAKMTSDASKIMSSMDEIKEKAKNNKWKFTKDTYLVTKMSASMSGGLKIVKQILEKHSK